MTPRAPSFDGLLSRIQTLEEIMADGTSDSPTKWRSSGVGMGALRGAWREMLSVVRSSAVAATQHGGKSKQILLCDLAELERVLQSLEALNP